ncbi:Neamine phosphoribosyltransferase [Paenibacillus sp. GbtcB18]|uniref:Neamine phosphoribosyltransferase n=1 Tax=Paenibacillus sp. GbtcB18 TaxID=2824763 RepID=UPI001C30683A|nr:Neamine phosphoribosyltransferase [Paenibacillus sp. GbtcB18]
MKDNPISLFHELESYVRGSKDRLHRYMYACILEQRLADLLLLNRCGVHPEDSDRLAVRLASQRSLCVQAASDFAEGTQEARGSTPAWPHYKVARSSVTPKRPELLSLIRVMQELRTPECSGYDLCDLEVCREDALHWLRDHADPSSPPILIGVRTGGAFYAPLWSSALRQRWGSDALYRTVRALRKPSDPGASLYLPEELSMLPDSIEPDTDIVILEDQPHTGGTVLELAGRLSVKYRLNKPVWVSSPGRLFKIENGRLVKLSDRIPLNAAKKKRIWQMLGSSEEVVEFLLPKLGLSDTRPADLEAVPSKSVPHWNDPIYRHEAPFRINPKKTPFFIRRKSTNEPVAFAKFIGKDLFGDFQFHQLKKFEKYLPDVLAYEDGYVVTKYEPGLREMRDLFVNMPSAVTGEICQNMSGYWKTLLASCQVSGGHPVHPLADHWQAYLGEMEDFIGRKLPSDPDWFEHSLHTEWTSSAHVYTSLPYANQYGHWRARLSAGQRLKTYRFHVDSTWGGTSSIEVELASFLLENRVRPDDFILLVNQVQKEAESLTVEAVADALPIACILQVGNLLKQAKGESRLSKELILSETMRSFEYLQAMKPKLSDVR